MQSDGNIVISGGNAPMVEKQFTRMISHCGRLLLCTFPSANPTGTIARRKELLKVVRPDITMDAMTDDNASDIDMDNYDALWIPGGTTAKLMNSLHAHDMIEKFDAFRKKGRLIYGGSAGAIIMGKYISIDPETLDGKYAIGLDWLGKKCGGGYSVASHWPDYHAEYVREFCRANKCRAICCPEDTGAIFNLEGNLVSIIGNGIEFIES